MRLSFLSCAERPFHLRDQPCQLAFKYIFITPSSLQINLALPNLILVPLEMFQTHGEPGRVGSQAWCLKLSSKVL